MRGEETKQERMRWDLGADQVFHLAKKKKKKNETREKKREKD